MRGRADLVPLSGGVSYFVDDKVSLGIMVTHLKAKSDMYSIDFKVSDSVTVNGEGGIVLSGWGVGVRPEFHLSDHERWIPTWAAC